jgi:hypothetical protein
VAESPPDELVGPALHLPPAGIEETKLEARVFGLLGARFVHLLDHLEGQDDVADLVGLAVPDQFDLAFVLEEQETVLVGQRLVRFEEADDLLLFLLRQSRHGDPLLLGVPEGAR